MFEIGQRVVCVVPADGEWFLGIPSRYCSKNLPVTGGIYTIRDIVTGSTEPGGPHWTAAPGLVGLLLEEIRNEPRLTTNGPNTEQSFDENEFMPLDKHAVARLEKIVADG